MSNSIGIKIKSLRKSLKLTQSQLAGDEITKSMLSQIENGLAKPSMKTLRYLSKQLDKPLTYFLEDEINTSSIPIEEINTDLEKVNELIDDDRAYEGVQILNNLLSNYSFNKSSKIYADILYKLGECQMSLEEFDIAKNNLNKSIDIYMSKNNFLWAAKAYLEFFSVPWTKFDYKKCLTILNETKKIYKKSINRDFAFEIELNYLYSAIYSALGNTDESFQFLDKSLKLSNKTKIYFKTDVLYRLLANFYLLSEDYEGFLLNINKAKQFADFTDNKRTLYFIEINYAAYYNKIHESYEALKHLEKSKDYYKPCTFYYIELTKAYYNLEEYLKAYDSIKKSVFDPENAPNKHRIDYLIIWTGKIYEGLILNKLGKSDKAIDEINYGIRKLEKFGNTANLNFAYKCLGEVFSTKKDFEQAFQAMKKADEIEKNTPPSSRVLL